MNNQYKKVSVTPQPNSIVYSDENGSISDWLENDPSLDNKVSSLEVKTIKVLTQAEYDALLAESAIDLDTFYVIISAS